MLVNNGAISKFSKSVFDITPEEFRKVIDTNLYGSFMCCKQFIEANKGMVTAESSTSPLRDGIRTRQTGRLTEHQRAVLYH